MRYHHTPTEMAKISQADKYQVLEEMWNNLTCWWECKLVTATLEKGLAISIKAKHTLAPNSTPRYIPKRNECLCSSKDVQTGNSLVAQWLRIRLPVQGTRVQALVGEDPTCRGATKPVRHNY